MKNENQKYIILPSEGLFATDENTEAMRLLTTLPSVKSTEIPKEASLDVAGGISVKVIDSIQENGPKLVEMSSESAERIRREQPGVRIGPLVYYQMAVYGEENIASTALAQPAAGLPTVTITVTDKSNGNPIVDARVVAFTNFQGRHGAKAVTDDQGNAILYFSNTPNQLEGLYIYPNQGDTGEHIANIFQCFL